MNKQSLMEALNEMQVRLEAVLGEIDRIRQEGLTDE